MNNRAVAIGGATTVILAGVSSALINELHGGLPWWIATAAVVLLSAVVSGWLAWRTPADPTERAPDRYQQSAISVAKLLQVSQEFPESNSGTSSTGAISAGRDITSKAQTRVSFARRATRRKP